MALWCLPLSLAKFRNSVIIVRIKPIGVRLISWPFQRIFARKKKEVASVCSHRNWNFAWSLESGLGTFKVSNFLFLFLDDELYGRKGDFFSFHCLLPLNNVVVPLFNIISIYSFFFAVIHSSIPSLFIF